MTTQSDHRAGEATRNALTIHVSGVSYQAAIADSQVPDEENWSKPEVTRAGRGWRYRYTVEPREARFIAWHLADVADALAGSSDDGVGDDRRALERDVARIEALLDSGLPNHPR
jgi:hypothetical protein